MINFIARSNLLRRLHFHSNTLIGCKGSIGTLCKGFSQQKLNYSNSSAYAGDGKTTVTVLNNELNIMLVNAYSAKGFRLSNHLFIGGSILLFPHNVYCWRVRQGTDITPESLLVFDLLVPKTKIVIIGYGDMGEEYDTRIPLILKKKGISCEMLPTPHAVTTYNYLAADSVHVAGAFIPVRKTPTTYEGDEAAQNIEYTEGYPIKEFLPESSFRETTKHEHEIGTKRALEYLKSDKKEMDP